MSGLAPSPKTSTLGWYKYRPRYQGRVAVGPAPLHKWTAATLDGLVDPRGAVFEAQFMLRWPFSEEGAAEKHMAQLQHNMCVTAARTAVLSIITGWRQMGGNDHSG